MKLPLRIAQAKPFFDPVRDYFWILFVLPSISGRASSGGDVVVGTDCSLGTPHLRALTNDLSWQCYVRASLIPVTG